MQGKSKLEITPSYQSFESFIKAIPTEFASLGTTLYKGRNEVRRIMLPNQEVIVVKRYKIPNLVQRMAYTLYRPSKAKRAFVYAERLLKMGIQTPYPIAYIETYDKGWFGHSYFLSSESIDPPLYPVLVERDRFNEPLATAFAHYLVKLHEQGFLHGDLNLNNILYRTDEQGVVHFTVIDTNRSQFMANPSRKLCIDNLKRVTHRRDLLRHIVHHYAVARGWDPELTTTELMNILDRFEHKERTKAYLKGKQYHTPSAS